ncbi:DNA transposase [Frankliniella fusca]|uniref:DNA transposase n=1 Tax=Frankliniella fusca TaxID=407009 RepID=A0AAE1HJ53_9NEOP|nr:DNA transposase [Frankliniella fusca]
MFLCPGHFTSDQFFSPIERKSLKRFAVPTVFDVQPLSETQMNIYKTHCDNTCTETSCGYSEHGIDLEPLGKHKLSDEEEDADEVASKVFVLDAENWEDEISTTTPVGTNEDSGEPVPEILDSPDDTSPSPPLTEVKAPRIGRTLISNGSKLRSKTCTRARVSANRLLQMSGVQKPKSAISADCAKVLRTAQQYRTMAQDVVRRLKLCQRQKTSIEKLCKRKFINQVEELLISPTSRQILRGELRNFRKKPRGRNWTLDDKLFWLAVFKRSPRSYRFLRQHLTLPCEKSLKTILNQVPLQAGISDVLLSLIKSSVSRMSPLERQCTIMFDEVFLSSHLQLNKKRGCVDGFEDFGNRGRTHLPADHALVFMVQGLYTKWVHPVAFYFVHKTCPSETLKILTQDVIKACCGIGLNVLATVSDQGPTNRGAVQLLKDDSPVPDNIIYSVGNKKLVHIWDVPHSLKNIRNNLLTSDLKFENGKVAKFRHIIEYFKLDEAASQLSKLTRKHLNPNGKTKMRVKYAAETLSETVSRSMEGYYKVSGGMYLNGCMPTVELLRNVDKYFDLMNGPRCSTEEKPKHFRKNVTLKSVHHTEWPKMSEALKKWVFIRKSNGEEHKPPCLKGLITNIQSMQWLWLQILKAAKDPKQAVLKLRHLNQDPLENLFACIRQCVGSGTDLTCTSFISALKTCIITKFVGIVKDKNCADDGSHYLSDMRSLLTEGHGQDMANNGVETETLLRGARPVPPEVQSGVTRIVQQAPSFLSAVLLNELIDSTCKTCVNVLTTSQKNANFQFCLSATHAAMRPFIKFYPTSLFIASFKKCQDMFLREYKKIMHLKSFKRRIEELCSQNSGDWSWYSCEQHAPGFLIKLHDRIAVTLISRKCKQLNVAAKSGIFKRTRQILAGACKGQEGLLAEEEEMVLDPQDLNFLEGPQTQLLLPPPGAFQFLVSFLNVVFGHIISPPTTPAPASTPVRRLVTPASSRRGNVPLTVTPTALSFQSPGIFPISGTPKLGLNGTSMTSASRSCSSPMNVGSLEGKKKVMAAWASSSSCTPVQPLPTPEAPIDMEQLARAGKVETLTRPVIAKFLKGKCKVSNIKKQDLCAAVYSFFNIQRK